MADEQQVIKAQSLIRGFLSRTSSIGQRIKEKKQKRAEQLTKNESEPIPAPFLPTPYSVISEMLTFAGVDSSSTVLDIGCGDGRVCIRAAIEKGAHGIGFESLPHVFQKAIELRQSSNLTDEQVELYESNFTQPNNSLLESALDRSNVIFVFLLPTDMPRIVKLVIDSIRRKHATQINSSKDQIQVAMTASTTTSTSSLSTIAATPSLNSCPCSASGRTGIVSWTFTLPSSVDLVLPLQPTHSFPLESVHTKLHLYDLCWCRLQQCVHPVEESHAYWNSKMFAASFESSPPPADTSSTSSLAASSLTTSLSASPIDLSCIQWGHALNTIDGLLNRLKQVYPSGLFIECDLRIHPDAWGRHGSNHSYLVDDVILAHDPNSAGVDFTRWYDVLYQYHMTHPEQPIGLKLDFKQLQAVQPTLEQLKEWQEEGKWFTSTTVATSSSVISSSVSGSLPTASTTAQLLVPSGPFLWLNADILTGPGASPTATPIHAASFVNVCQEHFPDSVLSIGWMTGTEGYYTHEHITDMLTVLSAYPHLHQFTYPLRASMVKRSWEAGTLQRLLAHCSNSTFTIWTSKSDQQRPGAKEEEEWIKATLPKARTFVDLIL